MSQELRKGSSEKCHRWLINLLTFLMGEVEKSDEPDNTVSSLRHYATLLIRAWCDKTIIEIQLVQQVTNINDRWGRRASMTYFTTSSLDQISSDHGRVLQEIVELQNSFDYIREVYVTSVSNTRLELSNELEFRIRELIPM